MPLNKETKPAKYNMFKNSYLHLFAFKSYILGAEAKLGIFQYNDK